MLSSVQPNCVRPLTQHRPHGGEAGVMAEGALTQVALSPGSVAFQNLFFFFSLVEWSIWIECKLVTGTEAGAWCLVGTR